MTDTFYRERANGRWEYWTYCEGRKVYVSAASIRQCDKLITVS